MKKIYFAVVETESGKHFAYVDSISTENNIIGKFADKVKIAHICASKKEAQDLSDLWNEAYKQSGTYMFS